MLHAPLAESHTVTVAYCDTSTLVPPPSILSEPAAVTVHVLADESVFLGLNSCSLSVPADCLIVMLAANWVAIFVATTLGHGIGRHTNAV